MIKVTCDDILRRKVSLPPVAEALARFHDDSIRAFVVEALEMAPDGFWLVPASSTGKHHPPFDNVVPGGLVNHSLVSVYFVEEGIRRYPQFTDADYRPDPKWLDRARAAAMLHDIAKCGIPWGEHTVPNHGHLGAKFLATLLSLGEIDFLSCYKILDAVKWHMGRWEEGFTDDRRFDPFVSLVQEADYYSTRKRVRLVGFNFINHK